MQMWIFKILLCRWKVIVCEMQVSVDWEINHMFDILLQCIGLNVAVSYHIASGKNVLLVKSKCIWYCHRYVLKVIGYTWRIINVTYNKSNASDNWTITICILSSHLVFVCVRLSYVWSASVAKLQNLSYVWSYEDSFQKFVFSGAKDATNQFIISCAQYNINYSLFVRFSIIHILIAK